MNKQPENNMDNQTLPAVQNPLERPVIPRTEDYIVENFRMLIDYSGGCMCGAIYVKGIFIETHCHKSSCGLTCEYGGLHIGKDWDCMLDEKYIAEKLNIKIKKIKFKSTYAETEISGKKVLLLKPQTFMNLSGEAVFAASEFYKIP